MRRAAALSLLALALLAGCGGDDESESAAPAAKAKAKATTTAAAATPAAAPSEPTNADTAFVNDMPPHHVAAVDMARVALTRAEHAELRELAEAIIATQNQEIATMRRIRRGLADKTGTFGLSHEEMGMDHDLGALRRAERFDREFIDMMVPHHEGAILMSQLLLDAGGHAALRDLAQDIITAQTEEIQRMREWRKAWYGDANPPPLGGAHD
jgi:uncharacterized protein (DUF305 family)